MFPLNLEGDAHAHACVFQPKLEEGTHRQTGTNKKGRVGRSEGRRRVTTITIIIAKRT